MFLFSETMPLLIAGLAAYCVGMGKAGVPSLSLVFNSLMLLALPSKEAIGLVLLLLIAGDLAALLFYRKHAEWKVLLRLLPAIAVGLAIGTYLLSKISNELVRPLIGVIVLVMFTLDQLQKRGLLKVSGHHPVLANGFGSIMGVTTVVGNAAGPISAMYFMLLGFDKYRFLGTSAWLFFIINVSKVPLLWSIDVIKLDTAYTAMLLLPCVLLGAISGKKIAQYLSEKVFSWLVTLSVLGASSFFIGEYLISRLTQ